MWILALDVGTSSVRAIGYDEAGRPLPGVDARTAWEPATTTDGGAELDPEALVVATASAIDRSLAAAPGPPAAVGASVFWHSLLGLDAEQRPLTGVITWADTRSARVAESLRSRLDETAVHARTGAPLHATFFPAKLTWLRETQPSLFGRAAMWCGFAEYLLLRLTGRLRASVSMASGTGLLEQSRAVWDDEMLAVCGIDPERLPPIDDAPVSGLEPRFRARWPTLGAVPWLPGAGDGACSNLGLDCATPDRVALNVGTSAALRLVSTTPRPPRGASGTIGSTPDAISWAVRPRRAATCWHGPGGRSLCPWTPPSSSVRWGACRPTGMGSPPCPFSPGSGARAGVAMPGPR